MPVTLTVVAHEDTNALRTLLSTPPTDAEVAAGFAYVERGLFGDPPHSRTALNGGWIGALSITRNPDGSVAEAQRTWRLDDAQMAASGLTTPAAVAAFAQRLADDTRASLVQRAARNRGGQLLGFWQVAATPQTGTVVVSQPPSSGVPIGTVLLGAAVIGGIAWFVSKGSR